MLDEFFVKIGINYYRRVNRTNNINDKISQKLIASYLYKELL